MKSRQRWHQYFELHSNCRHHQVDRLLRLRDSRASETRARVLAWGGFHARSRYSVPEEKRGTTRSLYNNKFCPAFFQLQFVNSHQLINVFHTRYWIIWTEWFLDWREDLHTDEIELCIYVKYLFVPYFIFFVPTQKAIQYSMNRNARDWSKSFTHIEHHVGTLGERAWWTNTPEYLQPSK